ncbi:MAG: quinone-interacting membrane-bound oxidoreductase complex subunit QmoC [Planctomycetota bacterium]
MKSDDPSSEGSTAAALAAGGPRSLLVDSDLDFIRSLVGQAGGTFKKCFQCGTCSGTCDLSGDARPFPRKEMAWAVWGWKDRLFVDPDVWLCHQCEDCSARCPRGARPGDVLAAIRVECIAHYAVPRFLGEWVRRPRTIPLLLAIPAAVLVLALLAREPIAAALGLGDEVGRKISFSYSSNLPHWLLNAVFFAAAGLSLAAMAMGVARFWGALRDESRRYGCVEPVQGIAASIGAVLRDAVAHRHFTRCTEAAPRSLSHLLVFFGFAALALVSLWAITARFNPLLRSEFVYPFRFFDPWKVLANLGGLAVLSGLLLMGGDRWRARRASGRGGYADWALIVAILLVVATGFLAEILHYVRVEPHRHAVYFAHLVLVFALLVYLPYSKLAHAVYRATALVFAAHVGWDWGGRSEGKAKSSAASSGGRS